MAQPQYQTLMIPRSVEITGLVTAFEVTYDEHFYYEGESHDFWEVVCVLEGKISATSDNQVYDLEQNHVILHRPAEFHRLWSASGTTPHLLIFSFEAKQMPRLKEQVFQLQTEELELLRRRLTDLENIFHRDGILLTKIKPGKELRAQQFLNELEIFLLQVLKNEVTSAIKNTSKSAKDYVRIVKTMQETLWENLSVEELAKRCHMSKSNLKKTFSKYARKGVIHHVNNLKVREGIRLLQEGYSVGEVSGMLGFREPAYFSAVFKRTTGLSPTKYLKSQQSEELSGKNE